MVQTYRNIGKYIVEYEQWGAEKSEYGSGTLQHLSEELTKEFWKGFSRPNLQNMKQFYLTYPICQTVSNKSVLSWSHRVFLMKLDPNERSFYEIESNANNRSLRELRRQFDSWLYLRLALSKNTEGIQKLAQKGQIVTSPQDMIKDPYVLEFLGLKEEYEYSESELEQAIINKIEVFLLELGKGFSFVGRQKRFTFWEEHFFVDLVFYNRLLQCFVLIDLKIGTLKHQDLGQMQMYVNYYDRYVKQEFENKTVWILLCKNKEDSLVEITLPEDSNIYASKYQLYLPDKQELKKLIEDTNK